MAINEDPGPFGPVDTNGTMIVVFWEYRPSNSAAYVFLALFGLATIGHAISFFRLRAWSFTPLLLGGLCEVFGYLERSRAHSQPTVLEPWILQNMLLLVAPPLLAATVYMSYGRITSALNREDRSGRKSRGCCARCCYSLCCTCSPTKGYVLLDIVALFTQLIGTVLPASGTEEGRRLSKIIVLVGLLAQLVALGVFLLMCGRLHVRLSGGTAPVEPGVRWKGYFVILEVAAVMLVVRSVVRGAEYLEGADGFVLGHEVFVYVFDAVPMLAVMVGLLWFHPLVLVQRLTRVGRKETRGFIELSLQP
ncbi:RTA1 like protein-domain-containing protein [Coniochaeta sp. 2T2.1]|nr:RTA1 like protein-domain-containing protein [Coniochaeta sp. 2T2.1]